MPKMDNKRLKEQVSEPGYKEVVKKPYHRFAYTEEVLIKAVERVRCGDLSLNQSSKLYKIPRSTLHNKIWNKTPCERKMGPTPVLTSEEENEIKSWIIKQTKLGFPMHPENVKDDVQKFLKATKRDNPFKNDRPGRKWFSLFLQRHPNILIENTELKNRAIDTEENIRCWFNNLEQLLELENASDILKDGRRILTCNELGLNFSGTNKLVSNFTEESSNKACIITMLTFSADGTDLPVTINYPCNTISETIKKSISSIPDEWAYGKTSGTIGDCFYDYVVNVLFVWLKAKNVQFPVILFRDAQKNYVSKELLTFCKEKKIILYSIPQYSALCHPSHVIFKRLKQAWCKQIFKLNVSMENFSQLFYGAFKSVINCDLIQNAFLVSGLFPFDQNILDYSKCTASDNINVIDEPEDDVSMTDLLRAKMVIEEIIGEEKVKQFQTGHINSDDVTLYSVWRRCSEGPEEEYLLILSDSAHTDS